MLQLGTSSMRAREHFRAHARRPLRLRAAVSDASLRFRADALIVDLALGGACLELPEAHPLRVGDAMTLQVHAPSLWDPLSLRARVAWQRRVDPQAPPRTGVRFEHVERGALYALFQLLGVQSFE